MANGNALDVYKVEIDRYLLKLIAVCRLVGCQDLLDETPSKLSSRRDSSTLSPMDSKTLDRRTKTRSISKHDFKSDVGGISICCLCISSFGIPQSAVVCCCVDKKTKMPVDDKVIHYLLSQTAVFCKQLSDITLILCSECLPFTLMNANLYLCENYFTTKTSVVILTVLT